MRVTLDKIKELRQITGAGVMACREALEAADCDLERAQEILREQSTARAAKKADRLTENGLVEAYTHLGKAGALVELNCETDFVARTPEFRELAHDLAMQVVAAGAQYVRPEDVPEEILEQEKAKYQAQIDEQNKPDHIAAKIMEGKLRKFYQEVCILNQPFIKDPDKTVQEVINEAISTIGENMVLRRFVHLVLGEG
jgi:elongation factor Ts